MPAPEGNKFWEARSSHGRDPIFTEPDQIWTAAVEYFAWVETHPLYEDRIISHQGVATHVPTAKMRAMSLSGLCIFLDIARSTWDEYCKKQDFTAVTSRV